MPIRYTAKLIPSCKGRLGIFELNNPKPLHALSLDMIQSMLYFWKEWRLIADLNTILIKSSPNTKVPAFCAGGDVKAIYLDGMNNTLVDHGLGEPGTLTADFFRDEYTLNYTLATSNYPIISFWNGIVMGGGAGISVHGDFRIATEHTLFAMPETAIGFFCDVGSTWWMPRILDGGLANYVALTGARLKPNDLLYSGIATHYVPSSHLANLETAIVEVTQTTKLSSSSISSEAKQQQKQLMQDVLASLFLRYHQDIPTNECFLAKHRSMIDDSFQESTVEAIVNNLERMNNDFASATLDTLAKMSPISLKVTLEGLRRGADCSDISQALAMEFRMSQAFMRQNSDFYSGIRAVLVDKDHNPSWLSLPFPQRLEDVDDDMVQSYFAPLQGIDDDLEWQAPT